MSARYDKRYATVSTSSREIVEEYRADFYEDKLDVSLAVVHYRGGQEEFNLGVEYSESCDSGDRQVGAQILGQLGWGDQCFRQESIRNLIALLSDNDEQVICAAAFALGHRDAYSAIDHLIKLVTHWSVDVRRGCVSGLSGLENQRAIDGLIQLSTDEDLEVRNWATFGLGTQIEANTNEVCNALREVLDSELADDCATFDECRGEALLGLAKRKVGDIIPLILREWQRHYKNILSIEAAELVADPVLLPSLLEFKETFDLSEDPSYAKRLDAAISACSTNVIC